MEKRKRGIGHLPEARRKEITSKGGKAAHEMGKAHEWDSAEAREAGRKGGAMHSKEYMRAIAMKAAERNRKPGLKDRERAALDRAMAYAEKLNRGITISEEIEPAGQYRVITVWVYDRCWTVARVWKSEDETGFAMKWKEVMAYLRAPKSEVVKEQETANG